MITAAKFENSGAVDMPMLRAISVMSNGRCGLLIFVIKMVLTNATIVTTGRNILNLYQEPNSYLLILMILISLHFFFASLRVQKEAQEKLVIYTLNNIRQYW